MPSWNQEVKSVTPPRVFPRRAVGWIVVLAVVLRLGLLTWSFAVHPRLLEPRVPEVAPWEPDLRPVGFEAGSIADALVCRDRGFADPFGAPTGPTAWISPGVVAPYAVAFALFGCFTPAAVVSVFLFAVAVSALLTLLAAAAANRLCGDPWAATAAAFLAAVSPFDLTLFTAASALDLNLHALLLLLLVYLLLGLCGEPRDPVGAPRRVLAFAAVAAVATLFNPVLAAVAAGGVVVALWPGPQAATPRAGRWRPLATALATLAAAAVLGVGPYVAYQRATLGAWVPVKSNAPFELSLGNRPDVAGVLDRTVFHRHHPSRNDRELALYRHLGEVRYVERHARRFRDEVSAGDFARWTLRRTGAFFFGFEAADSQTLRRLARAQAGRILLARPGPRPLPARRPGAAPPAAPAARRGRGVRGAAALRRALPGDRGDDAVRPADRAAGAAAGRLRRRRAVARPPAGRVARSVSDRPAGP